MATGTIKRLIKERGFGFIQTAGSSEEVFFHTTSLSPGEFDQLSEGQSVEFDVEPDPRDPRRSRAANVRVGS
jgi:CspA family cold shock protein